MKKPMYEVLGTITIPVYNLPKGVHPPGFKWGTSAPKDLFGVYVCKGDKNMPPAIVIPDGSRVVGENRIETDCTELLEMLDDSCSASCESIKTDLESTVSRLLEKATVEEVVALRNVKLI